MTRVMVAVVFSAAGGCVVSDIVRRCRRDGCCVVGDGRHGGRI